MRHSLFASPLGSAILGASLTALSACSTAASAGDRVVQAATIGRVDAPFSALLEARDCRDALDAMHGFTRETRGMSNGVFVVQAFDCKGERVVAKVSLSNHTANTMYCFAQTEDAAPGILLAPKSKGFYEYSYADYVHHQCKAAG
ncbi:MAG: hypothetical protein VXW22_04815 [Pseudomonadota bacterium]|jgi:hypothetical protein|nr:hypothetical protein [Pseudomonadota bacterium]